MYLTFLLYVHVYLRFLHLLIRAALRAHKTVVLALYKIITISDDDEVMMMMMMMMVMMITRAMVSTVTRLIIG